MKVREGLGVAWISPSEALPGPHNQSTPTPARSILKCVVVAVEISWKNIMVDIFSYTHRSAFVLLVHQSSLIPYLVPGSLLIHSLHF